ncbi:P43 5S RNA-binding protein-like [Pseudophryne corroboree]|uniref:P43 5S RNA-binding protein-like n=1 Tax=Pseudophryne corroboree TaxID=495146 RepID=UPI0030815A04
MWGVRYEEQREAVGMQHEQMMNNLEGKAVFPCTYAGCRAVFRKRLRLQEHAAKHAGQKPWHCDKPGCGKSFTRISHLQRHKQIHMGVKKYSCPATGCRAAFVRMKTLKRHQKYKHGAVAPLKCSVPGCSQTFQKKSALKCHVSEHTGVPQLVCDHAGCEWKPHSGASLAAHRRRHAGYRCPFQGCQTTFPTWTALQKHRNKHPLDLQCTKCKKPFKKRSTLWRHKATHVERRISLTCPREDCRQTFTTIFNLTHHIRKIHLCLQTYHCYHAGCSRTFSMRESLIRHLVVHDPDKKKLKLRFNPRSTKKNLRRAPRPQPSLEQDLSRLFNQKLIFRYKAQLESNLSSLFNERKFRVPALPEANLSSLFQQLPLGARAEKTA